MPPGFYENEHARIRYETISAGLIANKNRIQLVTNPPLQPDLQPKALSGKVSGGAYATEQSDLSAPDIQSRSEVVEGSKTSSKFLLMELRKRLAGWLSICGNSMADQAATAQEDAETYYHGEIARLVQAKWNYFTGQLLVVLDWEVRQFIAQCLGGDADLDAVMTVTGNARSAYCVTCRDYIEWQWGSVGLQVLHMASSLSHRGSKMRQQATSNIIGLDVLLEMSGPSIRADMRTQKSADVLPGYFLMLATSVVQVLAWMASVFRMPQEGPPHCSLLELPLRSPRRFDVTLGTLVPAPRSGSSCWHDLLPNTTVVTGFPIRTQEPGLDVGWSLMLDLADVMLRTDLSKFNSLSRLECGIFYSGVNVLLYPVSRSQEVIRWHFDASGKHAIPPPDQFLQVKNEEEYTCVSRHLVGYASQSEIRLGTQQRMRDYAQMSSVVGCIERGRPEIALDAFTATFGKAPASTAIGVKVKFPSTLRATVDPQQRRYDDIVRKTKDQAVILYDCGYQPGAWLVPQLSVIFDLVCYRMFTEQWGEPPKHPFARANGGDATAEVLKDPLVYLHKLTSISEDSSDFRIMDLVKEIFEAMLKRRILHEAPSGGSWVLHRERLHGWDLLEIADAPDQSFRREIEVHQTTSRAIAQYPSWLPLAQHIPVYVGQDLGHIISVRGQPLPMRHVKNREKCLVANVRTLQNLLRNRDECSDFHLDCELVWELPSSVASMFLEMTGVDKDLTPSKRIEHCLQRLQGSKDHVCTLRNERTALCANGLVIFGPETTKLSRFNELVDSLGIGALQTKD
jgi:hypothetical protein